MQAIRMNTGAYRGSRWHLVDGDGTIAFCGTDVKTTTGGKGSYQRKLERAEVASDATTVGRHEYICSRCIATRDRGQNAAVKLSKADMKALIARAAEAGDAAFKAAAPRPMIVGTPANMMASLTGGDDGGFDPNEPTYYVSEGICGSGGVRILPGTSRFARFLVKEGYATPRAYHGGVLLHIWRLCGERGSQSYARWDAASQAIVETLREAGVTAYNASWVD